MKTAFIIVDVHEFFLYAAPDDLVANIAAHISKETYDLIAFTVFKNTPNSNFNKSLQWPKCASEKDTTLPEAFKPFVTNNNVFTRAAYSAFSNTGLDAYLAENNIEKIILCGVDTDACVLATAFSAFDNGYIVDVDFDITYSGSDLESEAQNIMKNNLIAHKK